MRWIKLTAFTSFLFASLLVISSCNKNDLIKKTSLYSKTNIVMSGAQEVPVTSTSSATGLLNVSYSTSSRVLSYTFSWSGLTGVPKPGTGVFGLAPIGYPASAPIQTISTTGMSTTGSYSGTLAVDGVYITEQDILNGLYYVNIITTANPYGEIRAQVVFQ